MSSAQLTAVIALAMMLLNTSAFGQGANTIPGSPPSSDQTTDLRAQIAEAEQKEEGDIVRGPEVVAADEDHIRALQQMLRDAAPDPASLDHDVSAENSEEFTYRQNLDQADDWSRDDDKPNGP